MQIIKHGMLILTLILIIGQASAANVAVAPSSTAVTKGQTFDLNVLIDPNGTAIAGAQLNIMFNKSILNVNSITEGNLFKEKGASTFFNNGTINNSLGTVTDIYNLIIGSTNVSTPGTFIIFNATAISSLGTSGINLSNITISDHGVAVAFNVTNGSVAINTPKTGDINGNGKLTLVDAIYLAKHVGGFSGYETIYADGDINANGKVTLVDAIYLAKHVGGFIGYEKIY